MAESLQPRSALTPPRSPAPINATRPDFPVRAGQFLGACHPADWPALKPDLTSCAVNSRLSASAEAGNMISAVIRCVSRAQRKQCSSRRCLRVSATDDPTIVNRRPDGFFHVGTATRACTRRGRAEMARLGRSSPRAFRRALPQRAVEALLQRGAVSRAHARGHPAGEDGPRLPRPASRTRAEQLAARLPIWPAAPRLELPTRFHSDLGAPVGRSAVRANC